MEQLTGQLELGVPVERIGLGSLDGTIAGLLGYRKQDVEIRLSR